MHYFCMPHGHGDIRGNERHSLPQHDTNANSSQELVSLYPIEAEVERPGIVGHWVKVKDLETSAKPGRYANEC